MCRHTQVMTIMLGMMLPVEIKCLIMDVLLLVNKKKNTLI